MTDALTPERAEGTEGLVERLRKPAPKFGLEEFDPTYDLRQEAAHRIRALAAEVASANERADKLQGQVDALDQERDGFSQLNAKLKADNKEMGQVFDARWDATQRAIKRWQAANPGNDLTWPDHADLVVWLMDRASGLIPRAGNAGRYLAEANDGRLLYLNHATTWQECPNFITAAESRATASEAKVAEEKALKKIAFEYAATAEARVAGLVGALEIASNTCGDVTELGRFSRSVDPVRWVSELKAHLDAALSASGPGEQKALTCNGVMCERRDGILCADYECDVQSGVYTQHEAPTASGPGEAGAVQVEAVMTEAQIKHMVSRFLQWKLPENFSPDGGISFQREFNTHTEHPMKAKPAGTNLLDAAQVEAMLRHMMEGMPASAGGDARERSTFMSRLAARHRARDEFVADDGSLSADWVAMTLTEEGRVEDGRLANSSYLAVKIADAVDRIMAATAAPLAVKGEQE